MLFDVGHGFSSFSFDIAGKMIGLGPYPDTISSGVHRFSIETRARDILHAASKFLLLGMPLEDVIRRITSIPAEAIGHRDIGTPAPGSRGDAVILEEEAGEFLFTDSVDRQIVGERQLRPRAIIAAGRMWNDG